MAVNYRYCSCTLKMKQSHLKSHPPDEYSQNECYSGVNVTAGQILYTVNKNILALNKQHHQGSQSQNLVIHSLQKQE